MILAMKLIYKAKYDMNLRKWQLNEDNSASRSV